MEIKQSDFESKGSFYVIVDEKKLAEMTYSWAGKDRIIIDHTEVSGQLRGQGAGKQLVIKAVEFARQRGISIIPLCPFARSVFDKTPELRDVL